MNVKVADGNRSWEISEKMAGILSKVRRVYEVTDAMKAAKMVQEEDCLILFAAVEGDKIKWVVGQF